MRLRFRLRTRRATAAISLLLLVLFAHAFIVSATHIHRLEHRAAAAPESARAVRDRDEGARTNDVGGHEQCLLCRLQRNFTSDLPDSVTAPPAPQLDTHVREALATFSTSDSSFLAPAGRAPPLA